MYNAHNMTDKQYSISPVVVFCSFCNNLRFDIFNDNKNIIKQ